MLLILHKSLKKTQDDIPSTTGVPESWAHSKAARQFFLYSQHQERLKAYQEHRNTYQQLIALLKKESLPYIEKPRGQKWSPTLFQGDCAVQAVISVGGDGTLLEAASHLTPYDVPLIALRSSSYSLGFLCTAQEHELKELITRYKDQTLTYRSLSRMKGVIIPREVYRNPKEASLKDLRSTPEALNDILYTGSKQGSTSRYLLLWKNRVLEKQMSSGLWIYTPTGSTAVSSVLRDSSRPLDSQKLGFIVREANPNLPPSWSYSQTQGQTHGHFTPRKRQKPQNLISELWQEDELALKSLTQEAHLVVDGRDVVSVSRGDIIVFQRGAPLQLAQRLKNTHGGDSP